jgi:pyruvate dehydrogenase E1 component alpha subunit
LTTRRKSVGYDSQVYQSLNKAADHAGGVGDVSEGDLMNTQETATLVRLYEIMAKIKQCDERLRSMLSSGQIALVYYSPRGQEAISAAIGCALRADDYLVTTYRGLHDQLAKGVLLRKLWAEYLGKTTGICKGKGGPMHITDKSSGVMVTTGVVGSGLPIANGLALASQLKADGRVTVACFGDGASTIGAFHEALNLASLWSLPVVFVCQNNGYGEHTTFAKAARQPNVAMRGSSYAMRSVSVDGNDPVRSYEAITEAVQLARAGDGPTLVEASTYRFWGHYFGDNMMYMPPEERKAAMDADPVPRYRSWLAEGGHATENELAAIEAGVEQELDEAVEFALSSPTPDGSELFTDVYAEAVPS